MGIINITPDSFSDGGRHFDPAAAIAGSSALVLFFSKINPLWLLAGGGVLGAVLF